MKGRGNRQTATFWRQEAAQFRHPIAGEEITVYILQSASPSSVEGHLRPLEVAPLSKWQLATLELSIPLSGSDAAQSRKISLLVV